MSHQARGPDGTGPPAEHESTIMGWPEWLQILSLALLVLGIGLCLVALWLERNDR